MSPGNDAQDTRCKYSRHVCCWRWSRLLEARSECEWKQWIGYFISLSFSVCCGTFVVMLNCELRSFSEGWPYYSHPIVNAISAHASATLRSHERELGEGHSKMVQMLESETHICFYSGCYFVTMFSISSLAPCVQTWAGGGGMPDGGGGGIPCEAPIPGGGGMLGGGGA